MRDRAARYYYNGKIKLISRVDYPRIMRSPFGQAIFIKNYVINVIKYAMGKRPNKPKRLRRSIIGTSRIIKLVREKRESPYRLDGERSLEGLRVACLMDEFSYATFKDVCHTINLSSQHWEKEISEFHPDLLFVESAWHGYEDSWEGKISVISKELMGLIKYCYNNKIPTAIWNKDDPPHYYTFLETSRLFDFIFTTDIDLVSKYKQSLETQRVSVLPFTVNLDVSNPIINVERKLGFSFAGSYYVRYKDRARDFSTFVNVLSKIGDVAIYDRAQYPGNVQYSFPPEYHKMIRGSLDYTNVQKAHKEFEYGINMNSIKDSQSMCSRRVQELMAANTFVLSNYSRGARNLFGDLIVSTDDAANLNEKVRLLNSSPDLRDKIKLAALRKICSEYQVRKTLSFVTEMVFDKGVIPNEKTISIFSMCRQEDEVRKVIHCFQTQKYPYKKLIIVHDDLVQPHLNTDPNILLITRSSVTLEMLKELAEDWAGFFSPSDAYGPNYLLDLIAAIDYANTRIVGKRTCYSNSNNRLAIMDEGWEYRICDELENRSCIVRKDSDSFEKLFASILGFGDSTLNDGGGCVSLDRFNYCRESVSLPAEAADVEGLFKGFDVSWLITMAREIAPGKYYYLPRSDTLVIAPQYPSYSNLYRYMFVHRRVKMYLEDGKAVDPIKFIPSGHSGFYEYDDIDVNVMDSVTLDQVLSQPRIKTVAVHAMSESLWNVLKQHADKRIVVWLHGSEIQSWKRREFDLDSPKDRTNAIRESDRRMDFWRRLLANIPPNMDFIFVSKWFAIDVMEDLGIEIPENRYRIIHNPIDTSLFEYSEKNPIQRFKILSIRPYASRKYANDLTVKTIIELSTRKCFDRLEFLIVGDGKLFDETVLPLRLFPNVKIRKEFLRQEEIASLHKEYGVFLCPTRMDAQGVSRDEAMSSGLVPITNKITAIPEFVDDDCGFIVPPEDFIALADAVETLVEFPEIFLSKSRNAAKRVREQSDIRKISQQELAALDGKR